MQELFHKRILSPKINPGKAARLIAGAGLVLSTGEACEGSNTPTNNVNTIEATTISTQPAGIIVGETPTANPTVEVTPTPEKELNIFKPKAIRETFANGQVILALDENYAPVVNKLTVNPELPGGQVEVESRLADFRDKTMFLAWARLSQGISNEELNKNYLSLYKDYQNRIANGEKLTFIANAFNSKSNYGFEVPTEIPTDAKLEPLFVANPIDQAPIISQIQPTIKLGIIYNSETNTLTLPIYDTTAGGIDNMNSYNKVRASVVIRNAGIALTSKAIKEGKPAFVTSVDPSDEIEKIQPVAEWLLESLIGTVPASDSYWYGAVTTQK